MNQKLTLKHTALPFLILGAGGLGLVLRVLLYTLGTDSRGLLPRYHPLHVVTLVLTAATAAGLVWVLRKLDGSNSYRRNFPASFPAGLLTFFSAGWMLLVAFSLVERAAGTLDVLLAVLAFLSVPCLLFTGYCRIQGRRPLFLFHAVIFLFFALYMVCQYRVWSAEPQLPDYFFHIFACVFLTLSAYYHTAFDVGVGRRRMQLFCGLMAAYLCFLSLVGSGDGRFYFGGGVWALANLCTLESPPRKQRSDTIRIPTLQERA